METNILGKKIGMTQVFTEKGESIPVTIIHAGPCIITSLKSENTHGYNAVQLGYLKIEKKTKKRKITKPELGHLLKNNLPALDILKEYKVSNLETYALGQKIEVTDFSIGEYVNITANSIGKGNAGNIKRHHFNRGAMTHGSKHHRLQGSLGAGTSPGRVFPGKRMSGRLGGKRVTIKNLKIISIDKENQLLIIKGSIPGKFGNLLSIKKN